MQALQSQVDDLYFRLVPAGVSNSTILTDISSSVNGAYISSLRNSPTDHPPLFVVASPLISVQDHVFHPPVT